MIKLFWQLFFYQPLLNGLLFFAFLTGNFGWAIIVVTILLRLLLLPISWPALAAAAKMRQFAPELEKLKRKHRGNKKALAQAQMEFYRQKGINPASGCLPQIVQIIALFALYQAFRQGLGLTGASLAPVRNLLYPFLHLPPQAAFSSHFWYLDLQKPDIIHLGRWPLPGFFLIVAAVSQFLSSKLMMPAAKLETKKARQEGGEEELMASFQKQSLYLFPAMTLLFGFSFPSGLVLYWAVFSLVNLAQQWLQLKLSR